MKFSVKITLRRLPPRFTVLNSCSLMRMSRTMLTVESQYVVHKYLNLSNKSIKKFFYGGTVRSTGPKRRFSAFYKLNNFARKYLKYFFIFVRPLIMCFSRVLLRQKFDLRSICSKSMKFTHIIFPIKVPLRT